MTMPEVVCAMRTLVAVPPDVERIELLVRYAFIADKRVVSSF